MNARRTCPVYCVRSADGRRDRARRRGPHYVGAALAVAAWHSAYGSPGRQLFGDDQCGGGLVGRCATDEYRPGGRCRRPYLVLRYSSSVESVVTAPTAVGALGFSAIGLGATVIPVSVPWLPLASAGGGTGELRDRRQAACWPSAADRSVEHPGASVHVCWRFRGVSPADAHARGEGGVSEDGSTAAAVALRVDGRAVRTLLLRGAAWALVRRLRLRRLRGGSGDGPSSGCCGCC